MPDPSPQDIVISDKDFMKCVHDIESGITACGMSVQEALALDSQTGPDGNFNRDQPPVPVSQIPALQTQSPANQPEAQAPRAEFSAPLPNGQ